MVTPIIPTPSPRPQPPPQLPTSINSSNSSNTISIIIRTARRIPTMGRRLAADSMAAAEDTITAVATVAGSRSRTDKGLLPQQLLLAVV